MVVSWDVHPQQTTCYVKHIRIYSRYWCFEIRDGGTLWKVLWPLGLAEAHDRYLSFWSWQNRITDNTNNKKINASQSHFTKVWLWHCYLRLKTTTADCFLDTETAVGNFHTKLSNVCPTQFFLRNFSSAFWQKYFTFPQVLIHFFLQNAAYIIVIQRSNYLRSKISWRAMWHSHDVIKPLSK